MKYLSKLTSSTCNLEGVDGVFTGNQNLYGAATGEILDHYIRVSSDGGYVDSLYAAANGIGDYGNSFLTGIVYAEGGFLTKGSLRSQSVFTQGVLSEGSFGLSVDNSVVMTALSNGNVGIGTTSPIAPLTVLSASTGYSADSQIKISDGSTSYYGGLSFDDAGSTRLSIRNSYDGVGSTIGFGFGSSADKVQIIDGTGLIVNEGNVGIGTASPSQKLEANESSNGDVAIQVTNSNTGILATAQFFASNGTTKSQFFHTGTSFSGTGVVNYTGIGGIYNNSTGIALSAAGASGIILFGTGTSQTERMRITAAGNVGIGTTSPSTKLDVDGSVVVRSGLSLSATTTTLSPGELWFPTGGTIGISGTGGSLNILSSGQSETLVINGNVGIGTTNPLHKLQVDGNISIFGGTYLDFANGDVRFVNSSGLLSIQTYSVSTGLTTKMVVTGAGNVGIGTTNPGNRRLVVTTASNDDWIATFTNTGTTPYGVYIDTTANSGTAYSFATYTNAGTGFFIRNTGNVGIGTTSPAQKLHVVGNVRIDDGYTLSWGADTTKIAGNSSSNTLSLKTNSTDRLYIDSSGNVGIGTTSPSYKLDVVGQVRLSDNLYVGANKTSGTTLIQFNNYDAALVDQDDVQNIIQMNGRYWSGNISQLVKTEIRSIKDSSDGNGGSALGFATQIGGDAPVEHMRINKSGNVGIGTTSPDQKLHVHKGSAGAVASNGNAIITAENSTNGYVQILVPDANESGVLFGRPTFDADGGILYNSAVSRGLEFRTGGNVRRMVITSSGNVGIGTTSPQAMLDIDGNATATNLILRSRTGSDYANLTFTDDLGTTSLSAVGNVSGDLRMLVGSGLPERMRITATGNVGIGTASPAFKLDVTVAEQHIARFTSTTADNGGLIINKSNASYNPNILLQAGGSTKWYILNASNDSDKFQLYESTGTYPRFTLTQGGNVGIGTTSPTNLLTVGSTSGGGIAITTNQAAGSSGSPLYTNLYFRGYADEVRARIYSYDSAASNNDAMLIFATAPGGVESEKMRITSTGNVGIGTTAPNAKLQVAGDIASTFGSTNGYVSLQAGNATVQGYVEWFKPGPTRVAYMGYNDGSTANNLAITLENSANFIVNNGNVGIGTTSPNTLLDVRGEVSVAYDATYGLRFYNSARNNWSFIGNNVSANSSANLRFGDATGEVMRITGGNVGIGTTSPSDKLTVEGNISIGGSYKLYNGAASDSAGITFPGSFTRIDGFYGITFNSSTTNVGIQTERMRITNSGNVGIGTTSPSTPLHVNVSGASDVIRFTRDTGTNGGLSLDFSGANSNFASEQGGYTFSTSSVASAAVITSAGNVGIGTTSPGALLSLGSSVVAQKVLLYDASNYKYGFGIQNSELRQFFPSTFGARMVFGTISDSDGSTFSEKMRITSSGNVGIGTTSPAGKLSVVGDGTEYSNIVFRHSTNQEHLIYASTNIQYNIIGSSSPTWIWGQQGSAERMRLNNTGLGIGTTSPSQKLEVNGNIKLSSTVGSTATPSYIWLGNDFSNGTTRDKLKIYLYNSGTEQYGFSVGSTGDVQYHSNDYHDFYVANSNKVRITASGNVGIGTTSPTYKLDVSGTTRSTAFYAVNDRNQFARGFARLTSATNNTSTLDISVEDTVTSIYSNYYGGGADQPIRIGTYANLANQLYLATSGNVGIGTTSPNGKLDIAYDMFTGNNITELEASTSVYGNINFKGLTAQGAGSTATTQQGITWQINNYGGATNYGNQAQLVVGNNGNVGTFMGFFTSDNYGAAPVERLRIQYNGNVGIGTTSPSQKLDVSGTIRSTKNRIDFTPTSDTIALDVRGTGTPNDYFSLSNATGNNAVFLPIFFYKAATYGYNGGANQYPSGVYGGGFIAAVDDTGYPSAAGAGAAMHFNARNYTNSGPLTSRYLFSWGSWSSTYMVMSADGNLLINTTTDNGYKLYVNGTAYINNNAYINGNADIEGNLNMNPSSNPTGYNVDGVGTLTADTVNATTKNFDIPHPTKGDMRLRHGSLEGPEYGVYVRGTLNGNTIYLPDYWAGLVYESTITVTVTPRGSFQRLFILETSIDKVIIGSEDGDIFCDYYVMAERKDCGKLVVEY